MIIIVNKCYSKKSDFAIVFDMDGVLLDSETLSMECWKMIAQKNNLENIEKSIRLCIGTSPEKAKAILRGIYGQLFDYDSLRKQKSSLYKKMYEEGRLQLKPGVIELLKALRKINVPLGLATSTSSKVVHKELSDYNLEQYFDVVICGDMILQGKPHPEIYLKACSSLDYDAHQCYAIEDSISGLTAAVDAGMTAIMVPDMIMPDSIGELKEKIIVKNSLYEVKSLFEKII